MTELLLALTDLFAGVVVEVKWGCSCDWGGADTVEFFKDVSVDSDKVGLGDTAVIVLVEEFEEAGQLLVGEEPAER